MTPNPYEETIDKAIALIVAVRKAQSLGLMNCPETYLPPTHEILQRSIVELNDSSERLLAEVRTEVHAYWSTK